MKIAIIQPGHIIRCPHIQIFRDALSKLNIIYDIICWNRDEIVDNEGIICNYKCPSGSTNIKKIVSYYKFTRFVIETIRHNNYDKLIIIGSPIAICLYFFLRRNYSNKFWLDYRDLSIEQKMMGLFKRVLDISENVSISSPGYVKDLPQGYEYILSHNFEIDLIKKNIIKVPSLNTEINPGRPIVVTTIGYLRDTLVNIELIEGLKNNEKYQVRFIGDGPSGKSLKSYVENKNINNVVFVGTYEREEEHLYYETTDFVNIYFPKGLRSTLMSNRFYNALLYKKPLISTFNSTQSEYVTKYNLGIVVDNCEFLAEKIEEFEKFYDKSVFVKNCNLLLNEFIKDYEKFEKKMSDFIQIL